MAQIAHQLRSELMARNQIIEVYRARGDDAMVRKLKAAPVSMEAGTSREWMRLRDAAMHRIGAGHTHDMDSVITGIFLPMWRVRAYTVAEKIIEAPVKGFYTFDNSAHSPLFEEPARATEILLRDVLQGTNALADSAGRAASGNGRAVRRLQAKRR